MCFLQSCFPRAWVLFLAPRWCASPWYTMLADTASFQCMMLPWWVLFKKVVLRQADPSFVPNWEFELFALNCTLSPHLCASLTRATRFSPAKGRLLGRGGKRPAPHSG